MLKMPTKLVDDFTITEFNGMKHIAVFWNHGGLPTNFLDQPALARRHYPGDMVVDRFLLNGVKRWRVVKWQSGWQDWLLGRIWM